MKDFFNKITGKDKLLDEINRLKGAVVHQKELAAGWQKNAGDTERLVDELQAELNAIKNPDRSGKYQCSFVAEIDGEKWFMLDDLTKLPYIRVTALENNLANVHLGIDAELYRQRLEGLRKAIYEDSDPEAITQFHHWATSALNAGYNEQSLAMCAAIVIFKEGENLEVLEGSVMRQRAQMFSQKKKYLPFMNIGVELLVARNPGYRKFSLASLREREGQIYHPSNG